MTEHRQSHPWRSSSNPLILFFLHLVYVSCSILAGRRSMMCLLVFGCFWVASNMSYTCLPVTSALFIPRRGRFLFCEVCCFFALALVRAPSRDGHNNNEPSVSWLYVDGCRCPFFKITTPHVLKIYVLPVPRTDNRFLLWSRFFRADRLLICLIYCY